MIEISICPVTKNPDRMAPFTTPNKIRGNQIEMNLSKLTRPGKHVLLVILTLLFLTGMALIAGKSPARAQIFQTIDLSQPGTVDVTVLGAREDDHLTGNGAPDTFIDLTRARAIAVGDFNCDGIQDVAIGAPDADLVIGAGEEQETRTDAGAVYVIFGRTIPFPAVIDALPPAVSQPDVRIFGAAAAGEGESADNLGFSLASGDVDGDGKEDLIIGAPGADFPGSGEGEDEVPARPDTGAVFVLFSSMDVETGTTVDLGVNNAAAADAAIYGVGTGDRFGSALSAVDVGGPTVGQQPVADILAGAPENQGPAPDTTPRPGAGAAYIIFGGAAFAPPQGGGLRVIDLDDPATPADVIVFGRIGDSLGSSVAIDNINGGLANDMAIGAPGSDRPAQLTPAVPAAVDTGAVIVIFGGANLTPPGDDPTKIFDLASLVADQRPDITIYGIDANDHAGASVATGDVTGDSIPDLSIGAPDGDGPQNTRLNSGEAYVIQGGAALNPPPNVVERRLDLILPNPFNILTVLGEAAGDRFGSTVAAGIFNIPNNEDLIPDLFIGAPGAQTNRGTISMLFGGPNLNVFPTRDVALGQDDVRILGEDDGDELGWAIATGDLDDNQGGDLIAGAPFANVDGRTDAGKAYILLAADIDVPPVNQLPTVEVVAPNGGELLQGDNNFNITWTASDPDGDNTIQRFEIQLSTDSGATFNTTIADNVAGAARAFLWAVPGGLLTETARIRIIVFDSAGGQAQDDSDEDFSIRDFGVMANLLTPNGGEDLKFGQMFEISWDVPEEVADQVRGFDLFLSLDGGANFDIPIQFDPVQPALGPGVRTFDWTVPSGASFCTSMARVLVVTTSTIGVRSFSISDADFSISDFGPTVNVNNMTLNGPRTVLILRTSAPPVGEEIRFAATPNTTVEISNDEAGTTFSAAGKVGVRPSMRKLKAKRGFNGQPLGDFFPDDAIRILRVTIPPCGIFEVRVQRQGGELVVVNP